MKVQLTTNNSFYLYHANAECDWGPGRNPDYCRNMIDQDLRTNVCFVCWFGYFYQGERIGPKGLMALFHHWQNGGDW